MTAEEELERACLTEERAIEAMPDGADKTRRSLDLADKYMDNDMDNGALRIFERLARDMEQTDRDLRQRIVAGIMRLRNTDNDYVSERCSNIIGWLL